MQPINIPKKILSLHTIEMRNKQDITVNKVSPLQGFSHKSRRDGTLLTVGEAEGVTCGSNNCYILFISHL
jgi:hypothetical protein